MIQDLWVLISLCFQQRACVPLFVAASVAVQQFRAFASSQLHSSLWVI